MSLMLKQFVAATCGKPYPMHKSWVRVRRIRTNNTSRSNFTRAMDGIQGPVRRRSGERISEGRKLVWCARFGAAATDKAPGGRNSSEEGLMAVNLESEKMENRGGEEEESRIRQRQRLLTLPTILTLGRVAAVPLLVTTFYMNSWWVTTATTSIFIMAAITDWLDGYIARKMQLGTAFGAFLDPVADKLMVAATLVLLCTRPFEVPVFGQVPWLLTVPSIVIIGREITMSAVREWAASQNSIVLEAVAVNNLGKWKTATQMTALTILLATRDSSLSGSGALAASGAVLLYVSAGLAVWSLVVYLRKIWRILLK